MAEWYPAEWVAMLWPETTEVYSMLFIRVTLPCLLPEFICVLNMAVGKCIIYRLNMSIGNCYGML